MSWIMLFELFVIISLLVCVIKIEWEKVKVQEGKEKVEKDRKELLEMSDKTAEALDKVKIRQSKLQETMLWFAHEAGKLQTYSVRDTKVQYIKAEDLGNLVMQLTCKIYKIK